MDIQKMIVSNKANKTDKGYEIWSIKDSDFYTCNQ